MSKKKKKKDRSTGLEHGSEFVPSHIRPMDIQQQEFRTSMRGYDPREVDDFLDRLTEELASVIDENKRLRGGMGLPASGDVATEADDILRRARQEAEAVLREARARAASGSVTPSGGDPLGSVWPFLTTEREFLRSLASMVQDHAEGIKRRAREVQESAASAKPAVSVASPTRVPAKPAEPSSAWSATAGGPSSEPVTTIPPTTVDTPGTGDESKEEPSLRELFWGDEN